jgi:hypothetical protein
MYNALSKQLVFLSIHAVVALCISMIAKFAFSAAIMDFHRASFSQKKKM